MYRKTKTTLTIVVPKLFYKPKTSVYNSWMPVMATEARDW